jgi:hypothetical protein
MVVSGFRSTSISQPLQETWDRKAALPQASKLKQKNKYRRRPAQRSNPQVKTIHCARNSSNTCEGNRKLSQLAKLDGKVPHTKRLQKSMHRRFYQIFHLYKSQVPCIHLQSNTITLIQVKSNNFKVARCSQRIMRWKRVLLLKEC